MLFTEEKSSFLIFISSLISNPQEYISEMINLCLMFFIESSKVLKSDFEIVECIDCTGLLILIYLKNPPALQVVMF